MGAPSQQAQDKPGSRKSMARGVAPPKAGPPLRNTRPLQACPPRRMPAHRLAGDAVADAALAVAGARAAQVVGASSAAAAAVTVRLRAILHAVPACGLGVGGAAWPQREEVSEGRKGEEGEGERRQGGV
jgi:hypothetical protein